MKKLLLLSIAAVLSLQAAEGTKEDYGKWWEESAYGDKVPDGELVHHLELMGGMNRYSGDIDASVYNATLVDVLRYDEFSNALQSSYKLIDMKIEASGGSARQENLLFYDYVRYEFTSRFFGQVGFEYKQADEELIDDRISYYGGLGYRIVDTTEHKLIFLAALGKETLQYQGVGDETYDEMDNDMLYFDLFYLWRIKEGATFKNQMRYYYSLDDDDYQRWEWDSMLSFSLTPILSVVPTYSFIHNEKPHPYGKKDNSILGINLQVSF